MKESRLRCDICGNDADYEQIPVLTYRTFDDTDGQSVYKVPKIESEEMDLCHECAMKSTNVHSVGVQRGKWEIRKEAPL